MDLDFELSTRATQGAWRAFNPGAWQERVDVRDFIQRNYRPYEGEGSFLNGATGRTLNLWDLWGNPREFSMV